MEDQFASVEALIGYTFANKAFISDALVHASAREEKDVSNERMEFLGDSVVGIVVSEYLYLTLPDYDEGPLSVVKSVVVSRPVFADVARVIGVEPYVVVGKGMAGQEKLPDSMLCNVFESIVAAIYLDGGMEPAKKAILGWLIPRIKEVLDTRLDRNYKSILQHYTQTRGAGIPAYKVVTESGPDHEKVFEVVVKVDGASFGPASGKTKKDAEQNVALMALGELGIKLESLGGA